LLPHSRCPTHVGWTRYWFDAHTITLRGFNSPRRLLLGPSPMGLFSVPPLPLVRCRTRFTFVTRCYVCGFWAFPVTPSPPHYTPHHAFGLFTTTPHLPLRYIPVYVLHGWLPFHSCGTPRFYGRLFTHRLPHWFPAGFHLPPFGHQLHTHAHHTVLRHIRLCYDTLAFTALTCTVPAYTFLPPGSTRCRLVSSLTPFAFSPVTTFPFCLYSRFTVCLLLRFPLVLLHTRILHTAHHATHFRTRIFLRHAYTLDTAPHAADFHISV